MDGRQIAIELEHERTLVAQFLKLSAQHLELFEETNTRGFQGLVEKRAQLTSELQAIEASLRHWISDIQNNSTVTPAILDVLHSTTDDIVRIANRILTIDRRARAELE